MFGFLKGKGSDGGGEANASLVLHDAFAAFAERGSFEGAIDDELGFAMRSGMGGRQSGLHHSGRMRCITGPSVFALGCADLNIEALQAATTEAAKSRFTQTPEWKELADADFHSAAHMTLPNWELIARVARTDDIGGFESAVPGVRIQINAQHGSADEQAEAMSKTFAKQDATRSELVSTYIAQVALHLVTEPDGSMIDPLKAMDQLSQRGVNQFGETIFIDGDIGIFFGAQDAQVQISYVLEDIALAPEAARRGIQFLGEVSDFAQSGDTWTATVKPKIGEALFDITVSPDQTPFDDARGTPRPGAKIVIARRGKAPGKPEAEPKEITEAVVEEMDVVQLFHRLIAHLHHNQTVIGALDGAGAFQSRMMPEGMQMVTDPGYQVGGFLDRYSAVISLGGYSSAKLALLCLTTALKMIFETDPDWDIDEENDVLTTFMRWNDTTHLRVQVRDSEVQPWFDGRKVDGAIASFNLQSKRASHGE